MRLFILWLALLALLPAQWAAAHENAAILIETGRAAARITPSEALGAGLDGHQQGELDSTYTPEAAAALSSIPFHRLSYRLRTELGVAVWHWNEEGAWSDPANAQGYWISSDKADKPIRATNGYKLPRRGNTHDQASHDGYSRLDDGDAASFWKSNPYLDAHFTGEDNAASPQWVLINFEKEVAIEALRILWGEPFATAYEVQYWEGQPAEFYKDMLRGRWRAFPKGKIAGATGGDAVLRLSDTPVRTHYLRIVLRKGSETARPAQPISATGLALPSASFTRARSIATEACRTASRTPPMARCKPRSSPPRPIPGTAPSTATRKSNSPASICS